jgi:hypothetical protein
MTMAKCDHCTSEGYLRLSFEDGTRYCYDCKDRLNPPIKGFTSLATEAKKELLLALINEVVRTGHDDSMSRRFRKTIKGRRHLKGDDSKSKPDPLKRPVPKIGRKSNNNKPTPNFRKKKVLIDTAKIAGVHKEAIEFIVANDGKPITLESVRAIKDKLALQTVVNRMMAYHLDNWKEDDGKITNGQIVADPALWTVKEGILYNRATGQRPANFDWLYDLRTVLESTIVENIDTIKDMINGRSKT